MHFPNSMLPASHPYADFRNFLHDVWAHLGLPKPDPIQYDMAHWMQYGPKRSITQAFRGCGKSYIASAFACWCWLHDPDFKIMVVSGGKDRADDFSRFCLMLLRSMPELQHLEPREDQLKSLMKFDVNGAVPAHSPSCKSVGITGQLTGSRADLIIADDVETPRNSLTVGQREKLETLVTEFDAVLKTEAHTRIVYLGTPQTEDSLYNKLLTKGYITRIWPARMPKASSWDAKYQGNLAKIITQSGKPEGSPMVPRFSERELLEREASYGATGFALQFMLDTSLEDDLKFPLKARDFMVFDVDRTIAPIKMSWASHADQVLEAPQCTGLKGDRYHTPLYVSDDWTEYEGKIMFIDPSGRGKDRTGYAVVNHLKGLLFIRRWGTLEGGYEDEALNTLAQIARAEQVHTVVLEANFGDGMFQRLLEPVLNRVYPCKVEEIRVSKQKELRIIDTLEPLLNQHRLIVDKQILVTDLTTPKEHQCIYQMTRLTKDRGSLGHDDAIDALAGACGWWVEKLRGSMENIEEDHRQELFDREVEKWLEDVTGASVRNNGFRQDRRVHQ